MCTSDREGGGSAASKPEEGGATGWLSERLTDRQRRSNQRRRKAVRPTPGHARAPASEVELATRKGVLLVESSKRDVGSRGQSAELKGKGAGRLDVPSSIGHGWEACMMHVKTEMCCLLRRRRRWWVVQEERKMYLVHELRIDGPTAQSWAYNTKLSVRSDFAAGRVGDLASERGRPVQNILLC